MRFLKLSPLVWAGAVALLALLTVPAANLYYQVSWGEGCARCHEIRANFDAWQGSAHRKINCVSCHASSFQSSLRRVAGHMKGNRPDRVRLRGEDAVAMVERCRSCHEQEYAQWRSGPHSSTFAKLYLDHEHNRKRQLMDDCLRCHGMHFDGGIQDVVQPINTTGPWQLVDAKLVNRPAMPCLSCHAVHRDGDPMTKAATRVGVKQEIMRPSIGLLDRRARMNIGAAILPVPAMLEGTRQVKMSPDQRQSLCYQCHAALANLQVGTGDDRTPLGVHEGLGCLACHQKHAQNTRQSCADCHPRLSNCGIDVEKMDTTFANLKSKHNVHWVKCLDCHPKGAPKKKSGTTARAD
jgi:hypothetical protein